MAERRISQKQKRFLTHLLTSSTVREAAAKAQVSEKQAYRLVNDAVFSARWDALRHEAMASAMAFAQRETMTCAKVLAAIRDDPKAPASARISAAQTLLELGERARQIERDAEKITAYRKLAAELSPGDDTPCLPTSWQADNEEEKP